MLTLHYHPLASFCWKVLIALYETGIPFEAKVVDLGDAPARAAFQALWPLAKMPVLEDRARGEVIPETSIIIEYLERHYPGAAPLIPRDPELALKARLRDRILDTYVQGPMQAIVGDRLRPESARDPYGVGQARAQLAAACGIVEGWMADGGWALGDAFSLADCAAAPALFYADKVAPLGEAFPHTRAYLERLTARPSFARVLAEAEPYFAMFPG